MRLSLKEQKRLKNKYGNWAIVTGASSGIGYELAAQLASAGFNLLINARSADALEKMATHLSATYGITTLVAAADLSTLSGIDQLLSMAEPLPVGIIVCAAGYGSSGLLTDASLVTEINLLRLNAEAVLYLSYHFGRKFKAQGFGGIILLSSIVAFQGVPFSANYAATKAYVQSLAEALASELQPFGVDVLSAAPGPVASAFAQRANMVMSAALTPQQVGIPILQALGKKRTVFPGRLTKLLVYALRTVPRWGKIKIMQKVMQGMTAHQRA